MSQPPRPYLLLLVDALVDAPYRGPGPTGPDRCNLPRAVLVRHGTPPVRRRSMAQPDDPGELVGIQAGPADQGAVDVLLGHRVGRIVGGHRTAVLHPDLPGQLGPVALGEPAPD